MFFEFRTEKRTVELGYERGGYLFVTLPFLGTVQWVSGEGWRRYGEE